MPVNIHGKQYVTVAERVSAVHEDEVIDSLNTEVISHDPVVIKASVTVKGKTFTGISSVDLGTVKQIEKNNPYEVAETSAVGRALGFAGYGVIDSIASADEVERSIRNEKASPSQTGSTFSSGNNNKLATEKQVKLVNLLMQKKGRADLKQRIFAKHGLTSTKELTMEQASKLIDMLNDLPDALFDGGAN